MKQLITSVIANIANTDADSLSRIAFMLGLAFGGITWVLTS